LTSNLSDKVHEGKEIFVIIHPINQEVNPSFRLVGAN
jgi:hypothetical protein